MDRSSSSSNKKVQSFAPEDFPRGDNVPLEKAYRRHSSQNLNWARSRWGLEDDQLAEAFNEAVLIFRKKAWEGSLESYRGKAVNTILFSFAANLIRNRIKKESLHQSRHLPLADHTQELESDSSEMVEAELDGPLFQSPPEGRMADLQKGMEQLTERCRQILISRIVHGLSMPDIAEQLGMANADTAKTAKNKCLKRLKSLLGRLP